MYRSTIYRIFLLLVLLVALPKGLWAQELKVRSFDLNPMDATARTHPKSTDTGVDCAVVKVQLPLKGVDFDREWIIGDPVFDHGEYTLYMAEGARKLFIKHDDFHTLEVDFKRYNPEHHTLRGKLVYVLVIDLPESYRQEGATPQTIIVRDTIRVSDTGVSSSPSATVSPQVSSTASTREKPTKAGLPSTQFYVQPQLSVGQVMSGGLSVGGFVSNVNLELGFQAGLDKSEQLYWNAATLQQSLPEEFHAFFTTFRLGYGIRAGKAFRFTPQLGVNYVGLKGQESQGSAISGVVGLRAEYQFLKHLGLSLTPAYGFALKQSDVFQAAADLSSKVKGWGSGFGLGIGLFVCF